MKTPHLVFVISLAFGTAFSPLDAIDDVTTLNALDMPAKIKFLSDIAFQPAESYKQWNHPTKERGFYCALFLNESKNRRRVVSKDSEFEIVTSTFETKYDKYAKHTNYTYTVLLKSEDIKNITCNHVGGNILVKGFHEIMKDVAEILQNPAPPEPID